MSAPCGQNWNVGRLAIPGRSSTGVKSGGEVRGVTESVAIVTPFGISGSWERRSSIGISILGRLGDSVAGPVTLRRQYKYASGEVYTRKVMLGDERYGRGSA